MNMSTHVRQWSRDMTRILVTAMEMIMVHCCTGLSLAQLPITIPYTTVHSSVHKYVRDPNIVELEGWHYVYALESDIIYSA